MQRIGPRATHRTAARHVAAIICLVQGVVVERAVASSPARELPLFSIAKSENKNQVAYAVRVDDRCVPLPDAPVIAYWRLLEQGPDRVAPLLPREQRAYGIASQTIGPEGTVRLVLRALPSRPISVHVTRASDGSCHVQTKVVINGSPAYLFNVYLKLKWPAGAEYVLLRGWSLDRTHVVTEKLKP